MAILDMTDMHPPMLVHNGPGDVDYKRTLLVLTTTAADSGDLVVSSGPLYGSTLSTRWGSVPAARCVRREPECLGPLFWKLHLDYKTKVDAETAKHFPDENGDPQDQAEDPVDRPPKLRGSTTTRQKAVWKDVDGKPYRNTAGVPFARPLLQDVWGMEIEIEQNEPFPRISLMKDYQQTVNSEPFLDFPPKTVAIQGFSFGDPSYENGRLYYACPYRFAYDPDGWDVEELSSGLLQIESTGQTPPKLIPIQDKHGVPVSVPWPLRANGQAVTDMSDDSQLHYIKFKTHREKDYNDLFTKAPRFQL